ncbi:MAG: nucleotide exchange factor GrpE [Acidobacteriota bacterium]|nr:nucleotide exchange factor GrpE [Acidobacteriota bacterium]
MENNEFNIDEMAAENVAGQPADRVSEQLDQLRMERDGLKSERDELKELLLRRQAEFDNFRKRTEKERSEYVQYAGMELVKEVLPILDDFDRAMKVEGGDPEYVKGVQMIHTRMYDTLKKQGLEPLETEGRTFDPHLHQAVERVETKDSAEGSILGEFQRGYNFKGKLLRPSMVKVAVRS